MAQLLTDYRVFVGEFFRTFHSTGAILPSGRMLGRALARHVREGQAAASSPALAGGFLKLALDRLAVTRWIIDGLAEGDTLDLVELNESFVRRLEERLASDPRFARGQGRTRILHLPIEQVEGRQSYDAIVSGLPLNNFDVENVEQILSVMLGLLKPGGTLSFFEYVGVRPMRSLISGRKERDRLRGVGTAIAEARRGRAIGRDFIAPNVPPAWVHHLRAPASE